MSLRVSIVIPTLNEGAIISDLLAPLQTLRPQHQIILSDGGSTDDTWATAKSLVDTLVTGSAGRARQMNLGAQQADGDWLWFLHADSRFQQAPADLVDVIAHTDYAWGWFNVHLDAGQTIYRVIEKMINWRSCCSQIATGDQGIFVRRDLFQQLGGYAAIPLMEDIELSKRLRQRHRAYCARQRIVTSARRWQQHGVWQTILFMWRLRLAYFLGISPEYLARHYRLCNSPMRVS